MEKVKTLEYKSSTINEVLLIIIRRKLWCFLNKDEQDCSKLCFFLVGCTVVYRNLQNEPFKPLTKGRPKSKRLFSAFLGPNPYFRGCCSIFIDICQL